MKLIITGANGLLGSSIKLMALKMGIETKALQRDNIDVSSVGSVAVELDLQQTDVLIHCAANTDVEYCEQHPDASYQDNVLFTEVLANVCAVSNTKLVFISSTGVYGENDLKPFTECDSVAPTTVHHKCKLQAEKIVMLLAPRPLIIRTGWLFGGPIDNKKNFVANRIREAKQSNGVIRSDISQTGNPTFVDDLAKQLLMLVLDHRIGLFNCVNLGRATRFEYVEAIISAANIDVFVEPVSSASFERFAKVSSNESAVNKKLILLGANQMPDWRESLSFYVQNIGDKL